MAKKQPTQKFRQVACRVWKVMRMRGYSDQKKVAWLYLLTCGESNFTGIFEFSVAEAAEMLAWPTPRVRRHLAEFAEERRIMYDDRADVLLMLNWLEYKPIASKDTATGVATYLKSLPNSPLVGRWFEQAKQYLSEEIVSTIQAAYEGGGFPPRGPGEVSPRGVGGSIRGLRSKDKDKDKKLGRGTGIPPQDPKAATDGLLDAPPSPHVKFPPTPTPANGALDFGNDSHQEWISMAHNLGVSQEQIETMTINALTFSVKLLARSRTPAGE